LRHIAVTTVLGGALALAGAACDRDLAGEGIRSTTDPIPRPTATAETQSSDADVPDCYPEDAPPPNGEVVSAISFSQDDTFVCTFTVEVGELAPAMDGYRAELVADGWALAFDTSGDTRSFAVTNGDVGMLVTGEPAGGASTMSVTLVPGEVIAVPTTAAAA